MIQGKVSAQEAINFLQLDISPRELIKMSKNGLVDSIEEQGKVLFDMTTLPEQFAQARGDHGPQHRQKENGEVDCPSCTFVGKVIWDDGKCPWCRLYLIDYMTQEEQRNWREKKEGFQSEESEIKKKGDPLKDYIEKNSRKGRKQ